MLSNVASRRGRCLGWLPPRYSEAAQASQVDDRARQPEPRHEHLREVTGRAAPSGAAAGGAAATAGVPAPARRSCGRRNAGRHTADGRRRKRVDRAACRGIPAPGSRAAVPAAAGGGRGRPAAPPNATVTIAAVGDIVMGTGSNLPPAGGRTLLRRGRPGARGEGRARQPRGHAVQGRHVEVRRREARTASPSRRRRRMRAGSSGPASRC